MLHDDGSISEASHEDVRGKMLKCLTAALPRAIEMSREAWERIQHHCLRLDWVFEFSL